MRQCTQNLINQHLMDINPILAGWAIDWPGNPGWEPIRYYMYLCYLKKGHCTLVTDKGSFPVKEGQAFFIPLEDRTSYTIRECETYDYLWVGFSGSLSHRFSHICPVVDIPEDHLVHLKNLDKFTPHTAFDLAADLFLLRSKLMDDNEPKCDYVQHTIDYIQRSYMYPITVESLAAQVGLNRSYLSRLFKQKTGQTLHEHLQHVRFHQAKTLLIQGCSVKEAAYQCGFADDKSFHKIFMQKEGLTPTVWKKCVMKNLATLQYNWPKKPTEQKLPPGVTIVDV